MSHTDDNKHCDHPKDPAYGYCKVSGYTATYYCNDGYEVYGGDRVRECHDGYWGGKEPSCRKKCKLKQLTRPHVYKKLHKLNDVNINRLPHQALWLP